MTALWFTWFRKKWCSRAGVRAHQIYSICIYIAFMWILL